jgi:hypothetical protein
VLEGRSFSVAGAAQIIHVSEGTIKGEIRTKRLRATPMAGNRTFWVIRMEDLVEWFNKLPHGRTPRDNKISREIDDLCQMIGVERPVFDRKQQDEVEPEPEAEAVAAAARAPKTGF